MSLEEKTTCVKLDDKLADLIEIRRYGEIEGGFQRKLRKDILGEIIKKAESGEVIPPIVVARVDGKLRLLDGQHRLFAWKQSHFDLWMQITPVRATKAIESFCTINGTSRKVSLTHQLKIDPHPYAQKVRKYSELYKLDNSTTHRLMVILKGQSSGPRQIETKMEDWENLDAILKIWSNDPRWESVTVSHYYYRTPGILYMIVGLCKASRNPIPVLQVLKKMDYSKEGPFALRYGQSYEAIKKMREYSSKFLIRKADISVVA